MFPSILPALDFDDQIFAIPLKGFEVDNIEPLGELSSEFYELFPSERQEYMHPDSPFLWDSQTTSPASTLSDVFDSPLLSVGVCSPASSMADVPDSPIIHSKPDVPASPEPQMSAVPSIADVPFEVKFEQPIQVPSRRVKKVVNYAEHPENDDDEEYVPVENPKSKKRKRPPTSSSTKRRLPCPIPTCTETFTRAHDIQRHLKNAKAHSDKRAVCPYCNSSLAREDALKRHIGTCPKRKP